MTATRAAYGRSFRSLAVRWARTVRDSLPSFVHPRPTPGAARWSWGLLLGASPILAVALLPVAGSVGADLPVAAIDLGASFLRMLLAYLLSLGFALGYGYYAATHRPAERVLIPVLDILQSIPILGFFPIAIAVFVGATPGSPIGPNFASIFLIFTSMAWNMVFGVYESIKSMPQELREATESFGVTGRQRLRQVLLPATTNRLVYNSILSWTAGWYFLVAAEIISVGKQSTALPGIGSFLLVAAGDQDLSALIAGLALLVVLIALMDIAIWRPLTRWAEKFRYDQVPSGTADGLVERRSGRQPLRRAAGVVVRYVRTGVTRVSTPIVALSSSLTNRARRDSEGEFAKAAVRTLALGTVLTLAWLLLITVGVAIIGVFEQPIVGKASQGIHMLPAALLLSFGRVVSAYALSLAVALPLAIWVTRSHRGSKIGMPAIEVVASVPATALFPLFIFALLAALGSSLGPSTAVQIAAILMLTTGMLWYLFFNILSGLRSIPPDLEEAARSFGLSRRLYYRRLVLPAIFPAFITGSITAFGGGWNTLVIAEYIHYSASQHFQVLGIGELLNVGNQLGRPGLPLMAAALLVLILAVVTLNELLWKPLYRRAVERYRID
ncbi:MAG TPA: ABC transporter permease subunit [Thermoplasmata archaeon]|nr:ABC transporter permease subunit [Thermoplasmata archaeon]